LFHLPQLPFEVFRFSLDGLFLLFIHHVFIRLWAKRAEEGRAEKRHRDLLL